ncbi:polysaccharide deacetylase family protein [Clostridium sp. ZS2-4]|uniref:polysaccharide deacetylase family protein n=1 Tax=Clostridium sp. ZS2-4 TaxID=2987703 RepID=UPI00227B21E8|nr:polysaccharide deacetylase family protein [Clostridium sp. ZS2-4]MCY6355813.1 polysaccharide deacetylase [Clostridium sp. ZS2-4]
MRKRPFTTSLTVLFIIQTLFIFKIALQCNQAAAVQKIILEKKESLNVLSSNMSTTDYQKKILSEKIKKAESEKIKLIKENNQLENKLALSNTNSFYIANIPQNKIAYLTFDDGPSKNTLNILNILDRYNIKATFFVNGSTSQLGINTYKAITSGGHAIGNHTYSHNYSKIYKSVEDFAEDFNKLQTLLNSSVGIKPKIVRLPGGSNNSISRRYGGTTLMLEISKYLLDNGYTYFDWNIDSTDASVKLQSKTKIVTSVLNTSKSKSALIVLLHDNSVKTTTVEALPEIIEGLINQGFEFKTLSPNEYINQFLRAK